MEQKNSTNTTLSIKLRDYFEEFGLKKSWFAKKLGMNPKDFYQVLHGRLVLPRKYWADVIILTKGKITLKDILHDKLKDIDGVHFNEGIAPTKCEVSIKDLDTSL